MTYVQNKKNRSEYGESLTEEEQNEFHNKPRPFNAKASIEDFFEGASESGMMTADEIKERKEFAMTFQKYAFAQWTIKERK